MEFSRGHLVTNFVWRPLGSPLGFAIPGDSFSGIPPCFPPLGFTLIVLSWGTIFSPVGGFLFFSFLREIHIYSYLSTLNDFCLTVLPITPAKYGPKIYSTLVMFIIVIGKFGGSLFLAIYLHSSYYGWPTIPYS